jgi:hypothetical protein
MPKPATHAQIVEAPFGFLPPPEESATATLTGTTPTRITRALGGIKPHELWGKHERRDGPQFDYRLGTPSDWRSGWCVLTFREGVLMPPEFCTVIDEEAGTVFFRGELLQV